jgi:single-strand DNA-binding protein
MWAELGENAAATLKKGDRVIAQGRFEEREYTDKEGQPKKVWDMTVDEIGPSLRWATAQVMRTERTKAEAIGGGGAARRQEPLPNDPGDEEPF